jgi:DNA-binding response OmpR family regulator
VGEISFDTRPIALVVDDDASVRELVAFALEPRGWKVVEAANGADALACIRLETPRLIVLDCWMPVLDGLGFLRALTTLLPVRPPVILFTASDEDRAPFRELGVEVCVEKPADMVRFTKLAEIMLRSAPPARAGGERRRAERRAVRRRAEVIVPDRPCTAGFTVDISATGMALRIATPPPPGVSISITVKVEGASLHMEACVRNVTADGRVGVEFISAPPGVDRLLA